MDSFRTLYFEYCKTYNVEPQECVKSELKRLANSTDESSLTFNLSSHHLSDKTCTILAKLLAHDQKFNTIKFNDCSLSNEALRDICQALITNSAVKTLELKGNNIHGDGTESLAKLVRHNTSIKSLSLEWNSIGLMDTQSFPLFCESISINKTLQDLDIRNNQITHTGATELCAALEKNTGLKSLDLRWNSIGIVGGKAVLKALKRNHTITQLLIIGNNIPDDISEAINVSIGHNYDKLKTTSEFNMRTSTLTKELQNLEAQKDKQVNVLLQKIDIQEEAGRKVNRAMTEKMKKLQNALEDRSSTMNTLTSKLSMTEADLALSEQKCNDLQHALQRLELEKENQVQLVTSKAKRDREELLLEKTKLEKEMNEITARNMKLDDKIKELERKLQDATANMYEAREKLAQGQADYQIKMSILDEESRRLKQKHREELKEFEINKQRDIAKIKEDHELHEKDLKDRINKLESAKHSLEDEVTHLKATISALKVTHEQHLQEQTSRIQLEELQKRKELEDKLRVMQTLKEDAEKRYNQQNVTVTDLLDKSRTAALEIETLKRNNDGLRNQLTEKENDLIENIERVKTENAKRLRTIQKEIDEIETLKEKNQKLEIKLKDDESDYKRQIRELEYELNEMKDKYKNKEADLERYKDAEVQRDMRLQTMLSTFFNELKHSKVQT